METLQKQDVVQMMRAVSQKVVENERYLCVLDSEVGDGDHGVTVARGFKGVLESLEKSEPQNMEGVFEQVSTALSASMGGAIGPIFGSIFKGAALAVKEKEEIGADTFAKMLEMGLAKVMRVGGAKPGDRTLVDALNPAADAAKGCAGSGGTLSQCAKAAADAAKKGVEETKKMIAKKGRARFLGEKSIGHQDAGATTMMIVLESMADFIS